MPGGPPPPGARAAAAAAAAAAGFALSVAAASTAAFATAPTAGAGAGVGAAHAPRSASPMAAGRGRAAPTAVAARAVPPPPRPRATPPPPACEGPWRAYLSDRGWSRWSSSPARAGFELVTPPPPSASGARSPAPADPARAWARARRSRRLRAALGAPVSPAAAVASEWVEDRGWAAAELPPRDFPASSTSTPAGFLRLRSESAGSSHPRISRARESALTASRTAHTLVWAAAAPSAAPAARPGARARGMAAAITTPPVRAADDFLLFSLPHHERRTNGDTRFCAPPCALPRSTRPALHSEWRMRSGLSRRESARTG